MKTLTHIIQTLLGRLGMRISRVPTHVDPAAPFQLLDIVVERQFLKSSGEFFFVQIGANDGVLADSLNPLIRKFSLRGCLVEPMKDFFEDLKRNYADQPQLMFRNTMISDANGVGTIHRFKRGTLVPDFYHGLAREDAHYIRRRAEENGFAGQVEAVECQKETFSSLMATLPTDQINLLYVDTEGSDDKIIGYAFDAGVYPEIIHYEWTEMPADRRFALKMKLLENGYRFLDVGADTVCLRVGNE